jgi:integrase
VRTPSVIHTQLSEPKLAKFTNVTRTDRFIRDTDLRGFGVRVSPKNVKSYFVEATVHGKFVRRVIGQYPLKPLSEARRTALEALRELRYGSGTTGNPSQDIVLLKDVAEAFLLDKGAILRPTTMIDYTMVVRGSYFAPWMPLPVQSIKRRDVLDRYRLLCAEHGVGMANKAVRVLSSVLNYGRAIHPSLEDWSNPVRVLAEARAKRPVRPRTTFIPIDQLGIWLNALDSYRNEVIPQERACRREDVWLLLHLLVMTGLRSNEARSLRWSDIDLDAGTVTIKPEVAKNHRKAVLPLNSWLVEQLGKRHNDTDTYVFQAPRVLGYIGNLRRPLEKLRERSGLTVTPHDLRRTYATYLDSVGAPFGVIKQLLNHVSGSDITAQYVQNRSVDDLGAYADRVLTLIESKRNVIVATSTMSPCERTLRR